MPDYDYEYDPETEMMVETNESFDRRMEATYAPKADKPWRVAWGFGVFEDFATEKEAWDEYNGISKGMLPVEPFNTMERN